MISEDTRVSELLDAHPGLVDVLARFHPHFEQLRSARLRRMVGPRVTVGQAAAMAGVPTEALLALLRRTVGEPAPTPACSPEAGAEPGRAPAHLGPPRPAALGLVRPTHLDVRDDLARGVEPFARIVAAVKALQEGEALVLRVPFEPFPLYDVLGKRGLAHWTERHDAQDWSVWFYRDATATDPRTAVPAAPGRAGPSGAPAAHSRRLTLDVRGLEPPLPMVRVIEQLDALGPADELLVVHERKPMFLYPQLDDRGFAHDTREVSPGLVEILIRRLD